MYLINSIEPDFGSGWTTRVQNRVTSGWSSGSKILVNSGRVDYTVGRFLVPDNNAIILTDFNTSFEKK